MSKVYLPILCWEAASHLKGWKGCRFKAGIGVSTLTCLTGAGKGYLNIVGQHWLWGSGYGGTVGVSWTRDEKVSVDERGFLWWWEGQVESELR